MENSPQHNKGERFKRKLKEGTGLLDKRKAKNSVWQKNNT